MKKPIDNFKFGSAGEKIAVKYLKQKGYKILEKNYKTRRGEIDIIASMGDTIVFAEVKTRPANAAVAGMYAVNKTKQLHIMRTASLYLEENKSALQPRFDVIEVELDRESGKLISVNHIKSAFIQTEDYARF